MQVATTHTNITSSASNKRSRRNINRCYTSHVKFWPPLCNCDITRTIRLLLLKYKTHVVARALCVICSLRFYIHARRPFPRFFRRNSNTLFYLNTRNLKFFFNINYKTSANPLLLIEHKAGQQQTLIILVNTCNNAPDRNFCRSSNQTCR